MLKHSLSHAGLAALCLVAASCGGRPSSTPETERAREQQALSEHDVDAVPRSVAVARQLPARREIQVERVKERAFRALLREESPAVDESGLSPRAAFLLGFDFVPPPSERARLASASQVLEEEIAGFYDRVSDKIVLPLVPIDSDEDAIEQRAILAHEAQHALQAQHFPPPPEATDDDQRLAQLALWEGDAMVAMGAYLGAEAGAPVGRTLRRIGDATRAVSTARLSHGTSGRAYDRALPLFREELAFPYEEGMLFVTDLYRAGGYPLVNEAFTRPPRSTMEVLHPQKFLAGIAPRPFAEPPPPRGLRSVTSGTLGELRTRVLLSRCKKRDVAEAAAAGWAGDRFTVLVDDDGRLLLGWISAWDSVEEAKEFENVVSAAIDCFRDNELDESDGSYSIGQMLSTERRGDLVVVVRGTASMEKSADAVPAFTRSLLLTVRPALAAQPRSEAKVPPREALPEPRPGRVERGRYQNEWLGISGRIPKGMRARAGKGLELEIENKKRVVFGGLAVSTRISTKEQDDRTFKEALRGIRDALEEGGVDARVSLLRAGARRTPLGRGTEKLWSVEGTPFEIRMVQVPVCAGTGSVVFIEGYADGAGRDLLDDWVDSFRWDEGRNVEACKFLDPK